MPKGATSLPDKQRSIKNIVDSKDRARVIQLLTQFAGVKRYKEELRLAQQVA